MVWGWDVNVHLPLRHACDATSGMGRGGGENKASLPAKRCLTSWTEKERTATKIALSLWRCVN